MRFRTFALSCCLGLGGLFFADAVRAASVTVYRNDASSSGVNAAETTLTPANVNASTFGKLFSTSVDGLVQTQPLFMPAVNVTTGPNAGTHDLVFIGTQHDSLYAIDAQNGTVVWKTSFLDSGLSGATSITSVPNADVGTSDVAPEIGICGTPVIDSTTHLLYVAAKTKQVVGANTHYVYTLYKIDYTNGNATTDANISASTIIGDTICNNTQIANPVYTFRTNASPTAVQDPFTANSSADDAITVNGQSRVYFNALREFDRCGLFISGSVVYLPFASHGDNTPYHGWLLGYNKSTLAPVAALNTTPNGGLGGIWESGCAPGVDGSGNIYVVTGNGTFDGNNNYSSGNSAPGPVTGLDGNGFPAQGDYGDCVVKIAVDATTSVGNQGVNGWGLKVVDYFSPINNQSLSDGDSDLGSGGCTLLPDSAGSGAHPHLLVAAGKQGNLYLIDRDNMGKFSTTDHVVQEQTFTGSFSAPAFFNGTLYWALVQNNALAFTISDGVMATNPVASPDGYGWPGANIVISANQTTNGVAWTLNRSAGWLTAYAADNIADVLYTSNDAGGGRDSVGTLTKFSLPTVANGHVFVGTTNALVVYGLLSATPPAKPTVATGLASSITPASASVTGTANPEGSDTLVSFQYGTTTGYGNSTTAQDQGSGSSSGTFTQAIGGLNPSTIYHYRAVATSVGGTVFGADKTFKTAAQQSIGSSPQAYVTASGVQVGYTVKTDDLATSVYIQYGTDTSYGATTATIRLAPSLGTSNLFTFLGGLQPNTTYDYQVVTVTSTGTVTSSNLTFTTLPFAPEPVAAKGGANPALAGTTFASFGSPAINDNGNSAFRAVLTTGSGITAANNSMICADNGGGTLQAIAQTGTGTAPGTTAPFLTLDDPVYNNNNAVAFIGTLRTGAGLATVANNLGVWSNTTGSLALVAQKGTQAPGYPTGTTFANFSKVALPDVNGPIILGSVNANAGLGVTAANNIGIWAVDGSNHLQLIVRTGEVVNGKTVLSLTFMAPAAPVVGQSRNFSAGTGEICFQAAFTDRTTGIFDATSAASIAPVAVSTGQAPSPTGATYATFYPPAVNGNGNNAFRTALAVSAAAGVTTLTNQCIFADDNSNSLQLVARTGTGIAPGTTAPFAALGDPVYNDSNQLAFTGTLKVGAGLATVATEKGVWSNAGGALALVAQTGKQAPDCPAGVFFSGFTQIALPNQNGVALLATLTANASLGVTAASNLGIWETDSNGNLNLIVRTGQVIGGKTVTGLAFLPTDAPVQGQTRSFGADTGNLTYVVTFNDRSTAIYSLVYP